MLGKIMKHDFRATWRYFLLIDVVTLAVGVIAAIVGYSVAGVMDDLSETMGILLFFCGLAFVFAMFSSAIVTTIYNVVHYYRSLYSAEGYLTFTLPATTTEILSAKMLTAVIWQTINSICIGISVLLLTGSFFVYGITHGEIDPQMFFKDFWETIFSILGMTGVGGMSCYIANLVLQVGLNIMIFFFAISIGQLWQKHKIPGAIVAFFGTRLVLGIVSFVVSLVSGSFDILFAADDPGKYFAHNTMMSLCINIVAIVGMYISCIYITDKKLNLD